MCQLLMNNEFKTITIILVPQVDVSKKYKMKTGALVLLSALVHFYYLSGPHKYQNQLKISRCLCGTVLWCAYVSIRTGVILLPMSTARILIPIINCGASV